VFVSQNAVALSQHSVPHTSSFAAQLGSSCWHEGPQPDSNTKPCLTPTSALADPALSTTVARRSALLLFSETRTVTVWLPLPDTGSTWHQAFSVMHLVAQWVLETSSKLFSPASPESKTSSVTLTLSFGSNPELGTLSQAKDAKATPRATQNNLKTAAFSPVPL
jgi:hypothetical protein